MRQIIGIILVVVILFAADAVAEWRIDFDSKTVDAGQTGVTLNITAYWDLDLMGFTLPIVVRETDPGAFWAGQLPVDTQGGVPGDISWNWSDPNWADLILELKPGSGCAVPGNLYDGVSPDNFVINGASTVTPLDAEPAGWVVATFTFDVTAVAGSFDFDTACFSSALQTIHLLDNALPLVDHGPFGTGECSFNKGTITIADVADDDGDGIRNDQDNCPLTYNPGQENNDGDALGDVCDDDDDNDGVPDISDNCPLIANADQLDLDEDDIGDACDDCVCAGFCDLDGVGGFTPVDVSYIVNFVYKQLDARPELASCPNENGDWNCDEEVTPLDVTYYVSFVYKSWGDGPDDPCAP